MNGFLGIGNGHSEQRTSAGGNPPASPQLAARDPILIAWDPVGMDRALLFTRHYGSVTELTKELVVEMTPTVSSRLAIRNIQVLCR